MIHFARRIDILVLLFIFALPLICLNTSYAGTVPELVTDRPDQTESTVVIQPGYVQVETGFVRSDENGSAMTAYPGTLVRIGIITDLMEVRLGMNGWAVDHEGDTSGFGDSGLSAKIHLFGESGFIPDFAFLTRVTLPTGEKGYSSERYDPEIRFAFAHTLPDNVSLGYNVAVSWSSVQCRSGDISTLATFPWSVSLGRGLSERLGSFVELYGDIPINAFGGPANSFDCGFTYLVLDNFQLDTEGGAGLSEAADDWFVGAGVTYRIPR